MKHGTSEVVAVSSGLLTESAHLANGRVFERPAGWLREIPLVSRQWKEAEPVPGTKAERRDRSRESES